MNPTSQHGEDVLIADIVIKCAQLGNFQTAGRMINFQASQHFAKDSPSFLCNIGVHDALMEEVEAC